MQFNVITIFPDLISSYASETILGRAQKEGLIDVNATDPRDYTTDKHRSVDDTPYGGGAGMVMKPEPLFAAVEDVRAKSKAKKTRTILLTPRGETFTQKKAQELTKYDELILISGRYEGIDERVHTELADEELSIGDYVLSGGELAALVVVEAVARLLPGVLGSEESLAEESFSDAPTGEYPQYTKPAEFRDMKVPDVLLSGDHAAIEKWRKEHRK